MPTREIGTRFKLEGEQKFNSAMKEAASAIKVLNAEQKLAKANFEETGDAQQYAADQARILKEQIEQQKKAVEAAETAVKKLTENGVDKNSAQMQKWRTKLVNAQTTLKNMQNRLNKVEGELGEEGKAFNDAEADANQYQTQMEEVNKGIDFQNTIMAIDKVTEHIEKVIKTAAKAAKAMWEMGVDAGKWADDISTAANQAGVDPATYQSWQYASRFIDTSVDDIIKNWRDIDNKLGQTGEAYYEYAGSLAQVGIATQKNAREMRQGSEIFWDVIDYLHGITDESKRTAEATRLFGNDWRKLNPLITAGSKAYQAMATEGMSVAVVSNENVAALGAVDDAVQDLEARVNKLKMDTLAEMAPTFEKTAQALSTAVSAMDEFVQSAEGQAALAGLNEALSGIIDSFLGEDNGKGTFKAIIEGATDAVKGFTDAMNWIKDNQSIVVGAVEALGIAWAGLKTTKEVLLFMQLLKSTPLDKIKALFTPGKAAAEGAGSAASNAASAAAPAASPVSGKPGLPSLAAPMVALAAAETVYLESAKQMAEDNKAMKDAVVEASQEVVAAAAGTRSDVEKNLGQEKADLRDELIQSATDALRLVEDRSSQAAPGIGMYVPTLGVNRPALTAEVNRLKKNEDELENLLSEETLERVKNANPNGGFLGIGSMGDQQLWDLVNDVSKELANQTGEAQKAAEQVAFTFASAPEQVAEEATAAVEEITQAAAELSEKERQQRDAAQKAWDAIRNDPESKLDSTFIAWDQFESAFGDEKEKFEQIADQIDALIDNAGDGWQSIEDLPDEWFASGSAAVDQLSGALLEGEETAADASAAVAAAVTDQAKPLEKDMNVYGQNAAVGLANGIDRRAGTAVSAASAMAASVSRIVSRVLMIRSPSKVMEGLGEYTGEGFALGIENSAADVDRAVHRMLGATARRPVMSIAGVNLSGSLPAAPRAAAAGSAAAEGGPDTVHVTMVMDEEVVADIMAPLINQKIGAKIQSTRR